MPHFTLLVSAILILLPDLCFAVLKAPPDNAWFPSHCFKPCCSVIPLLASSLFARRPEPTCYNEAAWQWKTELFQRDNIGGQLSSGGISNAYTCGPTKPCAVDACCGPSGWCGYGPKYCGVECQSNCEASAECGRDANPPGLSCPLDACCSRFGFCGIASSFCDYQCQSHCEQPKATQETATNSRKRIVAYWDISSPNHACGQMRPDQIPVHDITHLIVAHLYITPEDFKVTHKDGITDDSQILRQLVSLKTRNPHLNVMVSLGGWGFSSPGKWQAVFRNMVSTKQTRIKFIHNLTGFLTEYGFDGVDFDWQYPGAAERGGNPKDGANYAKLLQELQATSQSRWLVSFTTPTSYWYLKHYELGAMSLYADWVNLQSYDLHGVWDSDYPLDNHRVKTHSNLTEAELALNLFRRNEVSPDKINLGIGLYGRSFELAHPRCWKPPCAFTGPGRPGECTNTPGILSYKEIGDILDDTKARPLQDPYAGTNYFVYRGNNWVSYEDRKTLEAKVNFASNHGLGGIMIWALNLDDSRHSALTAITGTKNSPWVPLDTTLKTKSQPDEEKITAQTLPADLKDLFPKKHLPPPGSVIHHELISFKSDTATGTLDYNSTGVAFFLISGSDAAVASMSERDNTGIHFLDCPGAMTEAPVTKVQTARIVCLEGSEDDCFTVKHKGVMGTLVRMPGTCGGGSYVRAISLTLSNDQNLPANFSMKPVTQVYDFKFDYDMTRLRRDSGKLYIRIDYANVRGYWDAVLKGTGQNLQDRIDTHHHWMDRLDINGTDHLGDTKKQSLDQLIFHGRQTCRTKNGQEPQGFAIVTQGQVDVKFFYGFSMMATWDPLDGLAVHDSGGFVLVNGNTSLDIKVSGLGCFDTSKKMQGGPISTMDGKRSMGGHSMFHGLVLFVPYWQRGVAVQTKGDRKSDQVVISGYMSAKAVADWGNGSINFPSSQPDVHFQDLIVGREGFLKPLEKNGPESTLSVGTTLKFGLEVNLGLRKPYESPDTEHVIDMSTSQMLTGTFQFKNKNKIISLDTIVSQEQTTSYKNGGLSGREAEVKQRLLARSVKVGERQSFADEPVHICGINS